MLRGEGGAATNATPEFAGVQAADPAACRELGRGRRRPPPPHQAIVY